ncbi:hypothetical protein POM88_003491 [Heracleum sosnowskyi]|uniref:Uncharacterized protein n=1 Tax=Heracleum sosnowskyi TaxID=360622 RepID=A0AAD8JJQ5_9APIA|nr:hypothetical protein POM88_055059 [Heracleum sosnowskyi]KAK1351703.1 hypothetical protein POM88_053986 [Heracleum sosnowskyi]KAK1403886.1 hypothetical protein POM88_003491 [Heracleum sosnowskyi]
MLWQAKEEVQSEEVSYKSTEFKNQRKHAEQTEKTLSQKILLLQSESGRLDRVNNVSCKQTEENETLRAELEQMKASIRDTEKLLEEGAAERKTLESMAALLKMEAQNSLEELNVTRNAKDETKLMNENLQSELATVKGKINTFLVKEQDLQSKIKYLEKTVEILNQNAASYSVHECPKVAIHENYTIKSLGKRGVSDGHTNAESLVFVGGMKPLCEEVDRFKFSSLRKTMEEKLRGAKMKYRKIKFAIRKNKGSRQDDELKYQNSEKQ